MDLLILPIRREWRALDTESTTLSFQAREALILALDFLAAPPLIWAYSLPVITMNNPIF